MGYVISQGKRKPAGVETMFYNRVFVYWVRENRLSRLVTSSLLRPVAARWFSPICISLLQSILGAILLS